MQIQPISARELILTLIDSTSSDALTARYFVAAGELFEMDSGTIRVALARLVRDGSLTQVARGTYGLGSRGGTLHSLVRNWSQVESSVKPWNGGWLAIFTTHLTRSDKTRTRSRERALRLFGYAEPYAGLWVRPDNLTMAPTDLFKALQELGLDAAAFSSTLTKLEPQSAFQPAKLWDRQALEQEYATHLSALSESTARLLELTDVEAAKETLLVGRAATRLILLDPLLPRELVNVDLRQQMVQSMRSYDRRGKGFWRALFKRFN
jgi:phenylacetic acid degradation operon negative regulatory protein